MTCSIIPYESVAINTILSLIIIRLDSGIGHSGLACLTAERTAKTLKTINTTTIESGAKPNSNLPILIILSKFKIILPFLLRESFD